MADKNLKRFSTTLGTLLGETELGLFATGKSRGEDKGTGRETEDKNGDASPVPTLPSTAATWGGNAAGAEEGLKGPK